MTGSEHNTTASLPSPRITKGWKTANVSCQAKRPLQVSEMEARLFSSREFTETKPGVDIERGKCSARARFLEPARINGPHWWGYGTERPDLDRNTALLLPFHSARNSKFNNITEVGASNVLVKSLEQKLKDKRH